VGETLVGLIGGTGLGQALTEQVGGETIEVETPFGAPSAPVLLTRIGRQRVAVLSRHGPGHCLNPSQVPYRANVFALKKLGVTHILASGATGSLQESIEPTDLVIADQVIDKTVRPGRTFFDGRIVAHVEFAEPFCGRLRALLVACAADLAGVAVHPRGTYVCMEGPQFSTRAESLLHRRWGADLIGMTVMPEAKLAREAEICYALIAIPTDFDCWRPHEPGQAPEALVETILANVRKGTENALALMRAAVPRIADAVGEDCPCRSALALGIWTDRAVIPAEDAERLAPLVGKYLP
jgi:5'-methylthioadenosine phosphorylase